MNQEDLIKGQQIKSKIDYLERIQKLINQEFSVTIGMEETKGNDSVYVALNANSRGYKMEMLGEIKRRLGANVNKEVKELKKQFEEL